MFPHPFPFISMFTLFANSLIVLPGRRELKRAFHARMVVIIDGTMRAILTNGVIGFWREKTASGSEHLQAFRGSPLSIHLAAMKLPAMKMMRKMTFLTMSSVSTQCINRAWTTVPAYFHLEDTSKRWRVLIWRGYDNISRPCLCQCTSPVFIDGWMDLWTRGSLKFSELMFCESIAKLEKSLVCQRIT